MILLKRLKASNDTAYNRWNCHKLLCKLCQTFPSPAMGAKFTFFLASRPCGPAGWWALLLTKAGDAETNPGPTTLNKRVWIFDICYKQIHVRNQISIRCNRIEHWVHLRCTGIRQAQYTYTWTCHLHRESRLTTQTQQHPILPDPGTSRLHTRHLYHTHHCNQNTPPVPPGLVKPKANPLIHYPLSTHATPSQTHTHLTYSTNSSHPTHHTHP